MLNNPRPHLATRRLAILAEGHRVPARNMPGSVPQRGQQASEINFATQSMGKFFPQTRVYLDGRHAAACCLVVPDGKYLVLPSRCSNALTQRFRISHYVLARNER